MLIRKTLNQSTNIRYFVELDNKIILIMDISKVWFETGKLEFFKLPLRIKIRNQMWKSNLHLKHLWPKVQVKL